MVLLRFSPIDRQPESGQGGGVSHEELRALVEKTAFDLGEHCSSVQILVTTVEDGETHGIKRGSGDWYARIGMAHEFINSDIAEDSAAKIAEKLDPPDDSWRKTG